ncbi:MAG TPA: serpin family protein [Phycisphaerae bacterium]|nr:serpin family protein [Phycisphaerae bacterium]HRW53539.1 serpin family protein [Phycisphaerae bacterium]
MDRFEVEANDVRIVAQACNAFGLDLYRLLVGESTGGSVFFSPWSIAIVLTMLAEGARGETAEEMLRTLRLSASSDANDRVADSVHAGHAALVERLRSAAGPADDATRERIAALRADVEAAKANLASLLGGGNRREYQAVARRHFQDSQALETLEQGVDCFELLASNALWIDRRFSPLASYLDTMRRCYGDDCAKSVDFVDRAADAVREINEWVEAGTKHRIRDFLDASAITPLTRLILTNAVYFRGEWEIPFWKEATEEADFTLADHSRVRVKLMGDMSARPARYAAFNGDGSLFDTPLDVPSRQRDSASNYPGDDGFAIAELPYKGGRLAMTILAPRSPDGLPSLEGRLNPESLDAWLSKLASRQVRVFLPRFELASQYSLNGALRAMGMRRAFVRPDAEGGADFSGICVSDDPEDKMFVGAVVHKAVLEVTEEGTVAAAASGVALFAGCGSGPERVPFAPTFRADRPFLLLIRDTASGVILFAGRITRP